MPTVKMPRADWDTVTMCLEELMSQGWTLKPLYNEINDQLDDQEY